MFLYCEDGDYIKYESFNMNMYYIEKKPQMLILYSW